MKTGLRLILPLIILLLTFTSYGQDIKTQKYETGFTFAKGIYLTFENFKDNNPIPPSDIVSEFNRESSDFLRRVILNKKMSYITKDYDTTIINSKDAWGYSDGVNVFIHPKQITTIAFGEISKEIYDSYYPERITLVGRYCIFADQRKGYQNDFARDSYYETANPSINLSSKYIASCTMDFNTGEIIQLSTEFVREVLKSDQELYAQYKKSKLKARPRNYVFIMKYNEKNPIYFPVTDF